MRGRVGIRLWEVIRKESPDSITYQIAESLLNNIFTIRDTSSQALSELCRVSKPSISRFVKDIGYGSYYDFRIDLNNYHIPKKAKYDPYVDAGPSQIEALFFENVKANLDRMNQNLDPKVMDELVQDLIRMNPVYLMGHLQCGSTAESLCYNLFENRKLTTAVSDLERQKEIFRSLQGDELILVFSAGGHFFEDYFEEECVPQVPDGVKIYFITSNPEIRTLPGARLINLATSKDISGCNLSLDLFANLLVLRYQNAILNR